MMNIIEIERNLQMYMLKCIVSVSLFPLLNLNNDIVLTSPLQFIKTLHQEQHEGPL